MAGVEEDRPRLPYAARDRRSVGLIVLLLFAVLAAIVLIRNLSRRPDRGVATPVANTEAPPPEPVPAVAPTAPPTAAPAAAPAPAEAEDEPAISARKQSEIARVIQDGRPRLKICYQRALVRDATLVHGNLRVRASVAPSGRVDSVNISGPAAFRPLDPCLKATVSRWTFPSAPAAYEAEFPLELRAGQ
jgi:outer membrane biosynthesis protein TonB